ncbi:hypothetical protein COOONC_03849 [Cooperia oncophora]
MVVVIHVKSHDVLTRNTLRRTYGDKRLVEKFSYSLLFSVGRAGGPEEQELLREEARLMETFFKQTLSMLTES